LTKSQQKARRSTSEEKARIAEEEKDTELVKENVN